MLFIGQSLHVGEHPIGYLDLLGPSSSKDSFDFTDSWDSGDSLDCVDVVDSTDRIRCHVCDLGTIATGVSDRPDGLLVNERGVL